METAQKFLGSPTWRYFINRTIELLEHFKGRKEFLQVFNQLKECIEYMNSRLSNLGAERANMEEVLRTLTEINELVCHHDIDCISSPNAIALDLNKKMVCCADILKALKATLKSLVPIFKDNNELKEFCMRSGSIIFCSKNNVFHLNDITHPINCLIIDDANHLNEVDTLVPLCLQSLQCILLAGEYQALHKDEFGPTLFTRLYHLNFKEHVLLWELHQPKTPSRKLIRMACDMPKILQTEFSWIERPCNTKYILAPVRDQGNEGTCSLHSTMATTESLHKFYNASLNPPQNFTTTLEIEDMKLQYQIETGYEFGKEPKGEKGWIRVIGALSSLKNQGVLGFDEFASGEKVKKIKISSFENVVAGNVPDFHRACNYLHDGDILVGAIKMSYNYFELSPGEVYHYDPNHPIINPSNNKPMSHAVMFVGYGGHEWEVSMKEALAEKEAQHPAHLVYQNSYGKLFGFRGGFGRVGVSSVKNLAVVTI